MPHIRADRVMETTTGTGTGSLALAGAVTGFRSFSSVCAVGDTVLYCIEAVDGAGALTGDWETGIGTLRTGGSFERTAVIASSNAGAVVNFGAGAKRVMLTENARGLDYPHVQVFNSSGVWSKPAWARMVFVTVIGAGGGGGSGACADVSPSTGGAGAGGGARSQVFMPAASLPDTVAVTVGAGGTGGASVGTTQLSGNSGTDGGASSFGTFVRAGGGGFGAGGAVSFNVVHQRLATQQYGTHPGGKGGSGKDGWADNAYDTVGQNGFDVGWVHMGRHCYAGGAGGAGAGNGRGGAGGAFSSEIEPYRIVPDTSRPDVNQPGPNGADSPVQGGCGRGGDGGGSMTSSTSSANVSGGDGGFPGGGGGGGGRKRLTATAQNRGGNGAGGQVIAICW